MVGRFSAQGQRISPEQAPQANPRFQGGTHIPSATFGSVLSQFGSGVNERLANIIGLPINVLNETVGQLLPGEPIASPLETGFRDVFVGPDPQNQPERVARRTGEEVGATLPLAAVPFAAAAQPAVRGATGVVERTGQAFLQGIRNTPARAATGELAATTGAGLGAGVAQEVAPGSAGAEMVGQLGGGVAPAVLANTPTALLARGARGIARRVSPAALETAARDEVSRVIGPSLTPEAQRNLAEAQTLSDEIPGFQPSLAEATDSPSLIATQRRREAGAVGQELESLVQRRAASEEAIERFGQDVAPESADSLEYVFDTAQDRIVGLRTRVGAQQLAAERRGQQLADVIPQADRAATGESLRNNLIQKRQNARTRLNRLATDLGINDVDVSVGFGRLQERLTETLAPRSRIPQRRADRPELLDEILAIGPRRGVNEPTVTFQDFMELRSRATDDLLDAMSSAEPNRRRIRSLVRIKQFLDDELVSLFDNVDPALAENARQFRRAYFTEFIQPFERGAAFKVRQRDGRGFYRTPDERVAEAFFQPGNVTAARQFKSAFGDNPQAAADMEAAILDSLRDSTVRNGFVDRRRLDTWLRNHASVLREFPEISSRISDIDGAAETLAMRQADLDLRTRRIESTLLSRELAKLDRGTRTPEATLQAAIRDPRLMRRIVNGLRGSEAANAALKRAIWERGVGVEDLTAFLGQNQAALKVALGDEHFGNLQRIARARDILARTPAPQGQGFQPDPVGALSEQLGTGVPQLSSRFYAFKSGRLPRDFLLAEAGSRILRGRSILRSRELLDEALYNPQVAKDLAEIAVRNRVRPEVANRLNAWLFNLGLSERDFGSGEATEGAQ